MQRTHTHKQTHQNWNRIKSFQNRSRKILLSVSLLLISVCSTKSILRRDKYVQFVQWNRRTNALLSVCEENGCRRDRDRHRGRDVFAVRNGQISLSLKMAAGNTPPSKIQRGQFCVPRNLIKLLKSGKWKRFNRRMPTAHQISHGLRRLSCACNNIYKYILWAEENHTKKSYN